MKNLRLLAALGLAACSAQTNRVSGNERGDVDANIDTNADADSATTDDMGSGLTEAGSIELRSLLSGLCVGGQPAAGAAVAQYACADAITWRVSQIDDGGVTWWRLRAEGTDFCLELPDATTALEAPTAFGVCDDQADEQLFSFDGDAKRTRIVAKHSGLCLNVDMSSLETGAVIQQWTCGAYENEFFALSVDIAPQPVGVTKYAPGLWPQLNLLVPRISDTDGWQNLANQFASVAVLPGVVGIGLITTWGVLEGDTQGDYGEGDAVMDKLINELARPYGKPISIHVWPRNFGSGGGLPETPQDSSTRFVPDYILDGGHAVAGTFIRSAKLWDPLVNGYYIALWQHLGDRYNDSKWVHTFETEESADDGAWEGYSTVDRVEQWYRFVDEVKPHFPNTGLRIDVNFFSSWDQSGIIDTRNFVEYIYNAGCDISGPDMYTHGQGGDRPSAGEAVVRGMGSIPGWGDIADADFGTKDYRGLMSIAYHHEYINDSTREVLQNYSKNVIGNTHFVLTVAYEGVTDQNGVPVQPPELFFGDDGFYAYLQSLPQPITNVDCPPNRGMCQADWGND